MSDKPVLLMLGFCFGFLAGFVAMWLVVQLAYGLGIVEYGGRNG